MRTLAIIPSRYGSSRFPGKPLADIAGKSMVRRVYEQALKAFDDVCVATDDQRITDEVESFGGIAIMTSSSHRSGTDRCYEAYRKYVERFPDREIDLIMNIQGDEPLIDPAQLKALAAAFEQDSTVYLGTMAKRITSAEELLSPNTPKVIMDTSGFAIYFSRNTIPYIRDTQVEEWLNKHTFFKHIGLYAYKPDTLKLICSLPQSSLECAESLEQLRWVENGLKIKVVETDSTTFAVDTPEDLTKIIRYIEKDLYLCG